MATVGVTLHTSSDSSDRKPGRESLAEEGVPRHRQLIVTLTIVSGTPWATLPDLDPARKSEPSTLPLGGTAVVVGGGIAGLTAGVALASAGWDTSVLEQAPVFWEAGAGMIITPNGEAALAELGLADAVASAGRVIRPAGIRAEDGRWLIRFSRLGEQGRTIGIHRRSLHSTLREAAERHCRLLPGTRVLGLDPGDFGRAPATLDVLQGTTGQRISADLVIGADGISSVVREAVAPRIQVRPSGYLAWRAVLADDRLLGDDWVTWWGSGVELSVQRIGPDLVSWHCLLPEHARLTSREALTARFAHWPSAVRSLVERTEPRALQRHDINELDRFPESFSRGRAVLIGDAAHPMLPTLAQGANQAIEDAATLPHLLRPGSDLAAGFTAFDRARAQRTRRIAASSQLFATLGVGCPPGLEQLTRSRMLSRLPARWAASRLGRLYAWNPPR